MQMASNSSCFALSAERMALTHILRVRKAVCFVCLDYALLCHWGQKKNIACPTAQEPGARHRAKGETKQRREVAGKEFLHVPPDLKIPWHGMFGTSWNLLHLFCFNARR